MAPERPDRSRPDQENNHDEDIFDALWRFADSQITAMARSFENDPWHQRTLETQNRPTEAQITRDDRSSCDENDRSRSGWWGKHRQHHHWCHRDRHNQDQETLKEKAPASQIELLRAQQHENPTPLFQSFFLPLLPTFFQNFNDTRSTPLFSVRYLVFSEYSPLYLDRALPRGASWDKFGPSWMKDAYTDLLQEQQTQSGGKVSDEEDSTKALLDMSKQMLPAEKTHQKLPSAGSQKPSTELDLYERFLRDNSEQHITKSKTLRSQKHQTVDSNNDDIISTMKTVETKTSSDGITQTKTIFKKVFRDGREESNESVSTSRTPAGRGDGPVSSALRTTKALPAASEKPTGNPASGGGWFWSK